MSTNNISEKQIFSYVISTFSYWGIKSGTEQALKQAKKNLPSAVKQMKRCLFGLIILHIFDFKICINDYLGSDLKQEEIDQVIMAYLAQCQCPLLLEMKNNKNDNSQEGNDVEFYVGCNLQSSRNLLILCGWVMGVSDYFNQILPNAIQSRLAKIQNPEQSLKAVESLIQNKLNHVGNNPNSQQQAEQISSLYKSIKAHMYQSDCYKQKRTKLKARLEQTLQKLLNTTIPLETLLSGSNSQKSGKKQAELQDILQNEIENMNQRKYFWIWLQEKILKETQTQIKQNNQLYETFQANQNSITFDCQVDLQYLSKYIELCQYYDEKYQELSERMNQLRLTNKRFKEIEAEAQYQFKQTLARKHHAVNKKHLFIALQLKSQLKVNLHQPKTSKSPQENQENHKLSTEMNKKQKKQIKKYLQSIEDAIKFI